VPGRGSRRLVLGAHHEEAELPPAIRRAAPTFGVPSFRHAPVGLLRSFTAPLLIEVVENYHVRATALAHSPIHCQGIVEMTPGVDPAIPDQHHVETEFR
jgi:hypothetical protein